MTSERPYPSDIPAWISLLDAARLVVRLQTGDAVLASRMDDEWIEKAFHAYDTPEASAAYLRATETLRAAMRAGRISGKGKPLAEDKDRDIEAHEWAAYYCDFRLVGLVNHRYSPNFVRVSLIETKGVLDALGVKREQRGADTAQSKGGRRPDVAEEDRDSFVFDLMDRLRDHARSLGILKFAGRAADPFDALAADAVIFLPGQRFEFARNLRDQTGARPAIIAPVRS